MCGINLFLFAAFGVGLAGGFVQAQDAANPLAIKVLVNPDGSIRVIDANTGKEISDAQVIKAMKRKEDAEDLMERADNALDLTRAREQLRSAQWDLERVCRRIYGQDAPPNAGAGVNININLRRAPLDIVGEADVTIANESK